MTPVLCPGAVGVVGEYVLAACQEGMHCLHWPSATLVQTLPFPPDARPSPGQLLHTAQTASGSCMCLAGYRRVRLMNLAQVRACPLDISAEALCVQVWLYKPVAAQDQAYNLLAQGQVDEALNVLRDALDAGHAWAVTGCAEAAMLLVHGAQSIAGSELLVCNADGWRQLLL